MASFSIDEVRDSFRADMSQFLTEIGEAAGAMESSLARLPSFPEDAHRRPLFEAIAARAHAVAGTGSLVGATSLFENGRRLESLTREGRVALMRARAQLERAAQVAHLCAQGAEAMQGMLALELDHRREEADAVSREWERRLTAPPRAADIATGDLQLLEEGPPSSAGPADPPAPAEALAAPAREFTFEDGSAASELEELKAIFQEELRASLDSLESGLRALEARPEDLAAAERLERAYHTLKGASATVGLKEISQLAASLQHRVEQAIESGTRVPRGLWQDLADDTSRLLQLSGLRPLAMAMAAPAAGDAATSAAASGGAGPAREVFLREARSVLDDAARMAVELASASAEQASRIQADLGRLFHRAKGSSLVAGEPGAAQAAAALQDLCESSAALPPASLTSGLMRLASAVGLAPADLPTQTAPPAREECQVEQDPELWDAFLQECAELMEGIERDALALEESASPKELLQALMRQHHTLKGAVNSVGIAPTGRLLHRIEDFLEALLEAPLLPSMKLVADLLLEIQAEVRRHLGTARQGFVQNSATSVDARIRRVTAGASAAEASAAPSSATSSATPAAESQAHPPAADESGLQVSRTRAEAKPEKRYIRVATAQLDSLMNLAGELVVSRSRLGSRVRSLRAMQLGLSRSQRRLFEHVEDFVGKHEFANLDGRAPMARLAQGSEAPAFVDFGALELDRYDDVHVLARGLAEISDDLGEVFGQLFREVGNIAGDADTFGGIVSDIQREVTRARMVPLESVFARLRLPARDAASREKKEVRVATFGEEVSLDKTIADAIFQPMLHLVRNAVAHGIEGAAERESSGKARAGTLTLGARQESGQIVLEVSDDGRGLDLAGLRARGVAMGMIPPETLVTDPSVKDLVFAPGVSTAAAASMVSGRGFGGDVVRKAIERLNGSIRVETSAGAGSKFVITLPLTLAITRALLVRQSGRLYALPLYFAEHIVDLEEARVVESLGARRMKLGDSFTLVRALGQILGAGASAAEAPARGPVLVLRVGEQRMALQVDAVVAQEEIVVKGLGELLSGHPHFAGVTIRGDGELVLIVDVPGVMEQVLGAAPQAGGLSLVSTALDSAPSAEEPRPAPDPAPSKTPTSAPPSRASLAALPAPPPTSPPVRAVPPAPAPTPPAVSAPAPAPAPTTAEAFAVDPAPEQPPALAAAKPSPTSERGGPLRVLFVDDSVSVRKVAERTLTGLGVQVEVAVDGLDALETLRTRSFDLVFTDLEMPRMHGYELIRELRFLPAYRSLPVVVVSSRSGQKHQDRARALGANDYLTKPFNAESLGAALKRWARSPESAPAPGGRKEPA